MPPNIFDTEGFVEIKKLIKTDPVKYLFENCNIDDETQINGIVYAAKGLGSRHDSHYELSACGAKIRSRPKSEESNRKGKRRDRTPLPNTIININKFN